MVDQEWYNQDHSEDEPMLEQLARTYVETYPQYDLPFARMVVDTHPATQALLGRTAHQPLEGEEGAVATAPAMTDIKPQVGEFEWMGEVKEIPAALGYSLLARYREAARALHEAKARAKEIESEIMQELGGFETGSVDGQVVFSWKWVDSTSFDAKSFKEDPQRKALYEQYLKTRPTRRFKVDGTVGVE